MRGNVVLICLLWIIYVSCQEEVRILRNQWQNRPLHSTLAKQIHERLTDCSTGKVYHDILHYGMGSVVHIWSQAVCNAMQMNMTLQLVPDQVWVWNDKKFCHDQRAPAFGCYFNFYNACPEEPGQHREKISWTNDLRNCPDWIHDMDSRGVFRAAAMELLFSNLSSSLVNETQYKARHIFGPQGIPDNMITVHIRWGDKSQEMKLVPITTYIKAIQSVIASYNISETPSIFLVSESSDARKTFIKEVNTSALGWVVHYLDQPENPDISPNEQWPVKAAHISDGETGLYSIISLLIALEAKYYIITTGSNWSRLINELRTNVVDIRCNNCTAMIDLQAAHRFHNWRL